MNRILKYFTMYFKVEARVINFWSRHFGNAILMQNVKRLNQAKGLRYHIKKYNSTKSKYSKLLLVAAGTGITLALCESQLPTEDKLFFRSAQYGDVIGMKRYSLILPCKMFVSNIKCLKGISKGRKSISIQDIN